MQKLPRLNHDQIEFKITHDKMTQQKYYQSRVNFKTLTSNINLNKELEKDTLILDLIKEKHLHYHDQEVYGQFRKEMQEIMFNFLYTINRYDDGKSWKTTIDIPKAELYSLEAKLKSIISGI